MKWGKKLICLLAAALRAEQLWGKPDYSEHFAVVNKATHEGAFGNIPGWKAAMIINRSLDVMRKKFRMNCSEIE